MGWNFSKRELAIIGKADELHGRLNRNQNMQLTKSQQSIIGKADELEGRRHRLG